MAVAVVAAMAWLGMAVGFNVDTHHAVVIPSPASPDLLFGYSVALTRGAQLLVGEPRGGWPHLPELHEPGSLYRCRLGASATPSTPSRTRCSLVTLDMTGNIPERMDDYDVVHLKNDSMFASTVVTTSDGLTLACGPGWKNQLYRERHYFMNGLCYSLDWDRFERQPEQHAPLVDHKKQVVVLDPQNRDKNAFYYAFGEAGFSAHISQEPREVLLGAPGVFLWRGSAVRYRVNEAGQLTERTVARADFLEQCGYFGYSVTAGRFVADRDPRAQRVQYAAGAPRAAHTGKVLVFELPNENMTVLQEVSGQQFGEYFGAAVLAEDVNGDGLADLLVGAPLHSTPQAGDAGRVYVYLNAGQGRLRLSESPLGPLGSRRPRSPAELPDGATGAPQASADFQAPTPHTDDPHGARFGSSITSAGDINQDGYNDVWVGAPYEDGGRGAVYLFLGSPSGLRGNPAQRIAARDVGPDLHSFGYSLAATADVDDNGYRDLAVGAPLSGYAVVLLARPVARLVPALTASASELPLGTSTFALSACLQYTGHRAQQRAVAVVTLALDGPTAALDRAMFQLTPDTPPSRQVHWNLTLRLDSLRCETVTVAIRQQDIEDYTVPLHIMMRFHLSSDATGKDRPFCPSCPVLDPASPTTASLRVPFATGCRNNAHCRPELRLAAKWHGALLPLVLGGARELSLRVEVHNSGEPASLTTLEVLLPWPLAVARMPSSCHAPASGLLLLCQLGNSLGHNQTHVLEMPLDVSALKLSLLATSTVLTVVLNATSTAGGPAGGQGGDSLSLRLPLVAMIDLDLVGRASPEVGLLPESGGNKAVSFDHTYEVRDVGPTVAGRATLRLWVPVKAILGNTLGQTTTVLEVRVAADQRPLGCSSGGNADNGGREGLEEDVVAGAGVVRCGTPGIVCEQLDCSLLPLAAPPASTTVELRMRLRTDILGALGVGDGAVAVHTQAVVVLADSVTLPEGSQVRTRPLRLSTLFVRPPSPTPVQPWVVALSAAAGILLFLLLSLALRKVGFFGRKKIPTLGEGGVPPSGLPQKTAASGPSDDDVLLAAKETKSDAIEVNFVRETTNEVSDTHSLAGRSQDNKKKLGE